jgi:CubicO group peptidase (beta-lactamase class C family)
MAEGTTAPGFDRMRTAFDAVLARGGAGGAAVSVRVDGESVVDLWGGSARTDRPWTADTASVYYSMTKGLITLVAARLVEAGELDLDAPVTRYWPEFGQAGKAGITVRQVMSHRAGLSYPVEDISTADVLAWEPVIRLLERQEPLWEPDTAHQYHALTFGWLVGEIIQRITGLGIGEAFQRDVARPAHADAWIGVPTEELDRVATVVPGPGFVMALPPEVPDGDRIVRSLLLGGAFPPEVAGDGTGFNDPVLQQAAIPAGLGIGTAPALAAMWSGAILGPTRIADAVLDDMTRVRSSGPVLWPLPGAGEESWGTGFHVPSASLPMLGPTSFGHAGAGGQLSFADREHRVGFGFVTSDLQMIDDTRAASLVEALRESLTA